MQVFKPLNGHLKNTHNKRMQSDFGKLALASAADARRYKQ